MYNPHFRAQEQVTPYVQGQTVSSRTKKTPGFYCFDQEGKILIF